MPAKFNSDSTADNVLEERDLAGMRILVTGVSSGLGLETARALVAHGATVIGTARDLAKAQAETDGMAEGQKGSLRLIEMDLASLASVRGCADALLERAERLDVVICNAGVMGCPDPKTSDGFEVHFGTNHLGHFLFVNRIASLFRRGSRIVVLSSGAHRRGDVHLDDLNFEQRPHDIWAAYNESKTANVLFAVEFDRRHREHGIRAVAVHPGTIHTGLAAHLGADFVKAWATQLDEQQVAAGKPPVKWKTIPQGAATSVWAAIVAEAQAIGGTYCEDCHVAEINEGSSDHFGVMPYALDVERAKSLWTRSEGIVGERF